VATTKRMRAMLAVKPKSDEALPLAEAVAVLKKFPPTKFDQTVEIHMRLGIDPKQADQIIRGSLSLPHGIGKSKRVVVFAKGNLADDAKAAGAEEVGAEELAKKIKEGWTDFDVCIAAPDMMGLVGPLGKVLGKASFDSAKLVDNIRAFIDHIVGMQPSSVRGQYVKSVSISGTMTPGVMVAA
jgi:large subunit ribosomal protein L1